MNISDLKNSLEEIVHDTLYVFSKINKNQKEKIKAIKNYLVTSENVIEDIRFLISSRNNENYFAYDRYIKEFFIEAKDEIKLEILNNQYAYDDLIRNDDIYIEIWNSLSSSLQVDYLENKRKYTDLDIKMINSTLLESGNFKDNIILNEILNNNEIRKKIPSYSIKLNYSYNLLSTINLIDNDMCNILTKETYTKLLEKKCKSFDEFSDLYETNNNIYNFINNESLIFNSKDNEKIYNFILDNPKFISKFSNKYLDLFSIIEIKNMYKNTSLDMDAYSILIQKLYRFDEDEANNYFSEDSLKKCAKHSINLYPFEDLNDELKKTIFTTHSLFNRFIDTIMIEAINNYFKEDEIVNILRDDTFIDDMSSYAIELLLNKLSFKSSFNMLQRKVIFDKVKNLNMSIDAKDVIFIKGFLDSPVLVYKSEHNMLYEMLNLLSRDELFYYITLPYIIDNLSNYEIINLILNKEINLNNVINSDELKEKLNLTDIISLIDKSFEKTINLDIFKNKELSMNIFNINEKQFNDINFDEVNYLFETIRMKSLLSKQESKVTVMSYKSVLTSYLILGLEETLKLVSDGNTNITLNDVKNLQKEIVDEKILIFKENNSPVFQNMSKKIINNLEKIGNYEDINEFALNVRKNTYLDNIIYLMLDNNFDTYNSIIEKMYAYIKYRSYDVFASKKEIYDYSKSFISVYLDNKVKEYNNEFEKIILKNFKVLESVLYSKRKEIGKEYIGKLKFKIFVRALTDPHKDSYKIYFKNSFPILEIKDRYIKYLANDEVDFNSILEHVLIPIANDRFDKENCLNKLGINKPRYTDSYSKYLNDLQNVTELNMKIENYKNSYSQEQVISLMNYICYKSTFGFDVSKKDLKELNKLSRLTSNLDGEIYVDKSALKFIYKDNMDIYNIDEIIEYRNYLDILDEIKKKTITFINRNMNEEKVKNNYAHDYFSAINTDECIFPITSKYYEPRKRVFSLKDIENIFNGYDLANYKRINKSLEDFLLKKQNLVMVADGYYEGIVDNLGVIISKWDKIIEYIQTLDTQLEDLSLIGVENILSLINFEDNSLCKSFNKEIIKSIYEDGYYEINDLNKRINMILELFKQSFKRIKSSIPYLIYKDDIYRIEILDSYKIDILRTMNKSLYKIGAIGNDFLHYSILNKNGFQIGIYKESVLISKILGIRNGNTIYLNAVEGCKDTNYNELLRLFANQMISITRDDIEPIEYVTIVNNENYTSKNGLKLDTTICPVINNPINKVYYDFEKFSEYPHLINIDDIYTNYEDNISTLLASNNIVDKNNFKYYDADDKYYRIRNDAIKLSNNISEDYLNRIDTILYLCKLENQEIIIDDITLSTIKTIYLGDDYVIFVKENNKIMKYILPYDERAIKEVELIMETIEKE